MNDITIVFNDKPVIYNPKTKVWVYEGVQEDIVQKVNPELAQQINEALEDSVTEYQDRLRSEETKRKEEEKKERVKQINLFKEKVLPLIPDGFSIKFADPNDDWGEIRRFYIDKSDVDASIEYNNKVYSGFGKHTTSLDWMVCFNYKNHRFSSLEKAILNAVSKINETIAEKEKEKIHKEAIDKRRKEIAKDIGDLGISFSVDTKGSYDHRGRYRSREQQVAKISLNEDVRIEGLVLTHDSLLNSVSISDINIDGEFTTYQFKQLADFIRTML